MPVNEFAGKRVTVMGLGRFGGQVAAIRFLVRSGAEVTVTDLADDESLQNSLRQIDTDAVTLHLGGHRESDFTDTDLVVVSPAVPKKSQFLKLAEQANVPVTSEMNLFFAYCRGQIIGITGTVGKSTTVAMTGQVLEATDRTVHVGGNIGQSLLERVFEIEPTDRVVLELSSFQLEDLARIRRSPSIALITNLFPNHLDRHETFDAYRDAKANITRFQSADDILILNADDPASHFFAAQAPREAAVWRYGQAGQGREDLQVRITDDRIESTLPGREGMIITREKLSAPGRHNLQNAAAAAAVGLACGLTPEQIGAGLKRFRALPHRLEPVCDHAGVQWFNDSKSTTPESGIVALSAFEGRPVIAIVGGYDKGLDLSAFAEALATRTVLTIGLGQTGPAITEAVRHAGGETVEVSSLEDAVRLAGREAREGTVVLLSPGCASWDMFENYEARGKKFSELARSGKKETDRRSR